MASSARDIQFKELKDTISQLNTTIRTQNDLILSLQKSNRSIAGTLLITRSLLFAPL